MKFLLVLDVLLVTMTGATMAMGAVDGMLGVDKFMRGVLIGAGMANKGGSGTAMEIMMQQ